LGESPGRLSRTRGQSVGAEALPGPPGWARQAACAGKATPDYDPWHPPEKPASVQRSVAAEAVAVCAACVVQVQCGRYALELVETDGAPVGIWGGMTADVLRDVARSVGRTTRQVAQHGTRAKYVAGCRCELCRAANATGEAARRTAKGRRQLRECPALGAFGKPCCHPVRDGSVFCPAHAIPGDSSDRTATPWL